MTRTVHTSDTSALYLRYTDKKQSYLTYKVTAMTLRKNPYAFPLKAKEYAPAPVPSPANPPHFKKLMTQQVRMFETVVVKVV